MKSITEIAKEIGISKQNLRNRISKEPLCSQLYNHWTIGTFCKGRAMFFDETGEMLIKASFFEDWVSAEDAENYIYRSVIEALLQKINKLYERLEEQNIHINGLLREKYKPNFDYGDEDGY